ncbi:MAG: MoaD/ThiS family protein [Chloroflexi bacterium]|nr:MoaD/ThiS family protein [Chloroflexota bacterium]
MKVILRHPQRRELSLAGVRTVQDLARELGLNLETVLVIRGQELLTRDVRLAEDDTVEVRSAISGGAG